MRHLIRSFGWLCFLLATVWPQVRGEETVFVFEDGPNIAIYDAETLAFLGRPQVGSGGLQAIGVPDPAQPSRFLKYFIITDDTVHVLAPQAPFELLETHPLTVPVNIGDRSAALSPDGRWLLVAAGGAIYAFDADEPENPAPHLINMGGLPSGIAILPDSTEAFVSVEGSLDLLQISLTTSPPQRLAGPVELPSAPLTAAAAPNAAGVFTSQFASVTAVDPYENEVIEEIPSGASGTPIDIGFDMEAPLDEMFVATATNVSVISTDSLTFDFFFSPPILIKKVVSPRSDQFYLLSVASRQVFESNRDGTTFDVLRDPTTNTPFLPPAMDIGLTRSRRSLFIAFGDDGSLVKLSTTERELEGQTGLPARPTGLDVTGTPGAPGSTAALEVFGGDGQAGTPGIPFPRRLAVRAVDSDGVGVQGEEIDFLAFTGNVVFRPENPVTNAYGVAITEVVPPTSDEFEVEARTESGRTVRFRMNTGLQGRRGLEVVSGDFQIAMENTDFPRPTTIRTQTGGVDVPENELTISTNGEELICPEKVMTNSRGEATFQCSAGETDSSFPKVARATVRDEFGRDLEEPLFFTIVSDPDDLPRDPISVRPRVEIVGPAGEIVPDVITMRLIRFTAGQSAPNIGVEFESNRDGTFSVPLIARSGQEGNVTAGIRFGCRLTRGTITSSVNAPGLFEDEFPFRIVAGSASAMARIQGNGLSGDANERLDGPGQALTARVSDSCGNPVPNVPLTWEVNPPGAVTLDNPFPTTNGNGEASAIVVLGPRAGPASVTLRSGEIFTTFDLRINVTPTRLLATSGSGQQIGAGGFADLPLIADLLNDLGAGVEEASVEWVVVEGQGSFPDGATTLTDEFGRTTNRIRAGAMLGPLVVEARALEFTARFELQVVGRRPSVSSVGFVNGASFVVGMVPGGLTSIFGVGLMEGVDGVVIGSGAPFPETLRGTRVLVEGVPAPILSMANISGQEQINIQVPFFTTAPSNNIVVTVENNGVSASFTGVRTFAAQPGIFEVGLLEGRFAAALHADGELVTPQNPARDGETIQLFWTGGGPVDPILATNQVGPSSPLSFTTNAPTVVLDGQIQTVTASVFAPSLLTVYQANFVVSVNRSGTLTLSINMLGQASPDVNLPVVQ